jgi:cytochrome P450
VAGTRAHDPVTANLEAAMAQTPAVHGCPVDESFDPLTRDFLADPYLAIAGLSREERPIFFAPSIGYYVLTRYADIEHVFGDPAAYSAAVAQAPLVPLVPEAQRILLAGGHKPQPSMVSLDEPEHARLRKPTARAFSMKRVTAMIPVIEATTARLLDAVGPAAEFDLVAALAFPLPADIVFSLMGVPERDYAQIKHWSGYRAALGWGRPAPADQVEIAEGMAAYRSYLRDLVDAKADQPGDDLTSDLVAIHRENPGRLTLDEIASILFSLSFAGHETTTGLIGNTVRRLLEVPDRWEAVVRDPVLIPAAVEETLRYDPSVPVWRRVTTRPVTLAGVHLPTGARLFLWLAAAGRDSAAFSQPDVFDVHRPDSDGLPRPPVTGRGLRVRSAVPVVAPVRQGRRRACACTSCRPSARSQALRRTPSAAKPVFPATRQDAVLPTACSRSSR